MTVTKQSEGAFTAALGRIYGSPDAEALALHLGETYGVRVDPLTQMDRNVFRVDRHDGSRWVARVFPKQRHVQRTIGDADVLRFLEDERFPAERCADSEPVSTFGDQSVLVTEFVDGKAATSNTRTAQALGGLLGQLQTLPAKSGAVSRAAGALHHWSVTDGAPRADLAAAAAWLVDVDERELVPVTARGVYESLREEIDTADDCSDLPGSLLHPDFMPKNAIVSPRGELVMIDWTGSGKGPRVTSLSVLLFAVGLGNQGVNETAVEAAVAGYRTQLTLEADELARLGAAMQIRALVFATFQYCLAVTSGASPSGTEWWWLDKELIEGVAATARRAFARD